MRVRVPGWKKKPVARRRRAAGARPKRAKLSKPMVRAIKQISARSAQQELETKFVVTRADNLNFNSAINTTSEMYSLIPQVAQTTNPSSDWQRIGNDVTPISCVTDWHVSLVDSDRSMNIIVTLYCLQMKNYRYFPEAVTNAGTLQFLKAGNSSVVQGFNGYVVDTDLPINLEEYTLLKKHQFHLTKNVGIMNNDTTATGAPNIAQTYKHIRYSYKAPKQLRYNPSGATTYPNGHAPFWVIGYAHIDGSAPDVLYQDLNVSYSCKMVFKDA